MGSKKSGLLESLSDKCIMQSCTSFLRGFSSRLRVEDSDTSYLNLCVRGDQTAEEHEYWKRCVIVSYSNFKYFIYYVIIYLNLLFT